MSIEYIDLFGGAGGWSCGLKEQGWSQRGFYEIEIAACATASKNLSGDISPCDLTEVDHKDIADVEFLIGSPPCQGFSNEGKKNVDDIRNTLVGTYLDILESKMPEVFVFENVPGFSRLYGGRYQKLLLERASELGYKVSYGILNLSDLACRSIENGSLRSAVGRSRFRFLLASIWKSPVCLERRRLVFGRLFRIFLLSRMGRDLVFFHTTCHPRTHINIGPEAAQTLCITTLRKIIVKEYWRKL